jgi:hypothetical protein
LVDVVMGEKPIEKLQEERDALTKQLASAYASAPATNSEAYKKAQEALKVKEDLTFSDAEIDAFLPKELRRTPLAADPGNSTVVTAGRSESVGGGMKLV